MDLKTLPINWRTLTLGDLFTEEQLKRIVQIYNEHIGDESGRTEAFFDYFNSIRPDLERKGLLPEYAAYAVPFFIAEALKNG